MSVAASAIEQVDFTEAIRAVDAAYFDERHCGGTFAARIQVLQHCAADARLYLVFAEAFVFYTDDGGRTLREVPEINRRDGRVAEAGSQHADAIVETVRGTILIAGRDQRDGPMRGVTWRKVAGADHFERAACTEPAWQSSKSGNLAAGFFGPGATDMVALAIYASPAHVYFSFDDGRSFRRQALDAEFADHVHQVYLARAKTLERHARLWISGGDDPSGARSGLVTFETLDAAGNLSTRRRVLAERPGFRLVGFAGDGKHVYAGNESLAGGVVKILDSAESIERGDHEYALGKSRHDYHQFRSMVATPDGMLASATDSYAFLGDTVRADSGGFLYVSNDAGASFDEIPLGAKWCSSLAFDGASLWLVAGMNRPDGLDPSARRCTVMRVPRPPAWTTLGGYCAKPVIADSSAFYTMAGYTNPPRAALAPGEASLRVDMGPYRSIALDVETLGPGTLVVEGSPFSTWQPDHDPWRTIATVDFASAAREARALSGAGAQCRYYRFRNGGQAPLELRFAMFTGRR